MPKSVKKSTPKKKTVDPLLASSSEAEHEETETRRYLLLSGEHNETKRDEEGNFIRLDTYQAGDILESDRDLITIFGANRFKLVDDNKAVIEAPENAGEGKRYSRDEHVAANRDAINKVTEEEAAAYIPNDPKSKINYSENAGFEQPPPKEELETDRDKRIWEDHDSVKAVKEED